MEKSIVKSTINGQEEVWFETEKQAIEFMQSMKSEETYHESDEQIYVEIDGVSYELMKDTVIGLYATSAFGGIEVLGIDGDITLESHKNLKNQKSNIALKMKKVKK